MPIAPIATQMAKRPEAACSGVAPIATKPCSTTVKVLEKPTTEAITPIIRGWPMPTRGWPAAEPGVAAGACPSRPPGPATLPDEMAMIGIPLLMTGWIVRLDPIDRQGGAGDARRQRDIGTAGEGVGPLSGAWR